MLKFDITYTLPQHHFIDIAFYIDNISTPTINLHLPAWRPGRYEIGNFAKNVQQVRVFNAASQPLKTQKTGKDCWEVQTDGADKITVRYRYYANILNAGSTFLDESQLYINPVNCFMYLADRMQEPIQLQFIIPGNYHIATQLPKLTKHTLIAENFDQLADSPLIASASMKHLQYRVDTTDFHIWFQGDVVLDEKKIIDDFVKFTIQQIRVFGDCEPKEYHFLMQMLPEAFHHGVEHMNSSVNALGPGTQLMEPALYTDFVGLCSHELFHLWNVKRMRPKSMFPYVFDKENYSSLGYVYEGITTYYGDLVLLRSGVYTFEQFCEEINVHIKKHYNNYGRYNQSVADSSVDTWLDGYTQGIPDRKVNIYTEGLLAAFLLDAHCISQTEAEFCMDDMLRLLYNDYYKQGKGYEEADWKACIEAVTGHRYDWYFKDLIHGCGNIERHLEPALKALGLLIERSKIDTLQTDYGVIAAMMNNDIVVQQIAPNSEAYKAGIAIGDCITEIDGVSVNSLYELNQQLDLTVNPVFHISRNGKSDMMEVNQNGSYYFDRRIVKDPAASPMAKRNFNKWAGVKAAQGN